MGRRVLRFAFAAFLLVCAPSSQAQLPASKSPRIGYLTLSSPAANSARREAFLEGLRKLGYVDGQNISIEYRYADSRAERLPELAAELVHLKVNAIVAGGTQVNLVAKTATSSIPIVMLNSDDPLGSGLVETAWYANPVNLILRKATVPVHYRQGEEVAHAVLIPRDLRAPSMEVAASHARLTRDTREALAVWYEQHAQDRSAYKVLARSRHGRVDS